MTLIADVFPKLRTPKNVVKEISKMSRSRRPFEKQHGNANETLLNSEPHHLSHINCSFCRKFSLRKSLLVICKVLRMFVNILTTDDKYSLPNRDNLGQPSQMQLSQKQKVISQFVSPFLKARLSFEHFQ